MSIKKIGIVLLASMIGMLLCSGVALAGNCCVPINTNWPTCCCSYVTDEAECAAASGIWVGGGGCDDVTGAPCTTEYCTEEGKCVPEMSTIVLLATGLIGMVGYLRLRRKEE